MQPFRTVGLWTVGRLGFVKWHGIVVCTCSIIFQALRPTRRGDLSQSQMDATFRFQAYHAANSRHSLDGLNIAEKSAMCLGWLSSSGYQPLLEKQALRCILRARQTGRQRTSKSRYHDAMCLHTISIHERRTTIAALDQVKRHQTGNKDTATGVEV